MEPTSSRAETTRDDEGHRWPPRTSRTLIAAIANSYAAYLDFVRHDSIASAMARKGVPDSWLTPWGVLKVMGAIGLLSGFVVPLIGIAAAVGIAYRGLWG